MQNKINLKLFRSKNFFLSLGAVVLLAVLLGLFVRRQQSKLPEIFDYVPTDMDQVMINRAEKNIQNNANMLLDVPQAVKQQFQQIKVMIIVQDKGFADEQMIFLETKSDFSPQDFLQTINPEDETTSTYLRLDDGQYVFGPQFIIQTYAKPSPEKALFSQPELQKYISNIRKSSLSVVSNNDDLLIEQKQYSLLDSAKYLLMNITSETNGNFDFSAYVLLSKQQTGLQSTFKPQFTSLLKDSTIAYLELGKILSGTNIGIQLAQGSLQDILLKKLMANNLAIVISKGANMFNLGITIVANDSSLFADLEPFFPLLGGLLKQQPMFTGSQITTIQQPGKIGYDIMIKGIQKVGFYLEQENDQTKISIGNPIIDGKSKKLSGYSKSTLAALYIDMSQLLNVYKQFANIGVNTSVLSASQEAIFTQMEDKILVGDISLEKDVISIKGSIR